MLFSGQNLSVDDEVFAWDYVDYLLDNVTRITPDIRCSVRLGEPRSNFFVADFEYTRERRGHSPESGGTAIQVHFRSFTHDRIVQPYIQFAEFDSFYTTLEWVFGPEKLDAVTPQTGPRSILLSQLESEPVVMSWRKDYPTNVLRRGLRRFRHWFMGNSLLSGNR